MSGLHEKDKCSNPKSSGSSTAQTSKSSIKNRDVQPYKTNFNENQEEPAKVTEIQGKSSFSTNNLSSGGFSFESNTSEGIASGFNPESMDIQNSRFYTNNPRTEGFPFISNPLEGIDFGSYPESNDIQNSRFSTNNPRTEGFPSRSYPSEGISFGSNPESNNIRKSNLIEEWKQVEPISVVALLEAECRKNRGNKKANSASNPRTNVTEHIGMPPKNVADGASGFHERTMGTKMPHGNSGGPYRHQQPEGACGGYPKMLQYGNTMVGMNQQQAAANLPMHLQRNIFTPQYAFECDPNKSNIVYNGTTYYNVKHQVPNNELNELSPNQQAFSLMRQPAVEQHPQPNLNSPQTTQSSSKKKNKKKEKK